MQRPKRVCAIHDLSTFGRCSLACIIPVISVMGVQVCPIPTALLSTHTGGFDDIESLDCNGFISDCLKHYTKLNINFDCIYTGYLAKTEQFDEVSIFFDKFPNSFKVVDPVLGDNGKLYQKLTSQMVDKMRVLCRKADLITPNTTEAALLTNSQHRNIYDLDSVYDLILKLQNLTHRDFVITGVIIDTIGKCNICCSNGEIFATVCNYKDVSYDGTGDCFASAVTASLVIGNDLKKSVCIASDFIEHCLEMTMKGDDEKRNGIFLEYSLGELRKQPGSRKILQL